MALSHDSLQCPNMKMGSWLVRHRIAHDKQDGSRDSSCHGAWLIPERYCPMDSVQGSTLTSLGVRLSLVTGVQDLHVQLNKSWRLSLWWWVPSLSTGNELELRTKLKSLPAEHQGSEATKQPMSVWSKAFFWGSIMKLQIPRIGLTHQQKYPPDISPEISSVLLGSFTTLKHQCLQHFQHVYPFWPQHFVRLGNFSISVYETHQKLWRMPHTYHTHLILN